MAKFTLLTVLLLYLGMMYFGREAGLPDNRIGRETSLWAELFGGDGEAGPLALLTEPAATPAPPPARATQPAANPDPVAAPAPAPDAIASASTPETDEQPASEPLPATETEAAPDTLAALEPEAAPDTPPVLGTDLAPARSPRPIQRPERPVAIADVDPEATLEPEPAPDPVTAVLEAVLAEEIPEPPVAEGATDDAAPETAVAQTPETTVAETPEATVAETSETAVAETSETAVADVPEATVEALPETPPEPAPEEEPEPLPEPDARVATVFAPEATPRPLPKPDRPAEPLPAVALDAAPGSAETPPEPAVLDPEAPVAAPDPAAVAAAALAADPIAEPPGEPVVAAAPAPQTTETTETTVETDDEPVAAAVTPLAEAAPDIAPVADLPSNQRPLARPLQALDPVPPADLAAIEPELTAPDPAALVVEDPAPVQPETVTLPEAESVSADIVAVPLPEPQPEPEPVVPTLPDEPQGVLYVSSTGVIVRAGPSTGDRAVDEMPRGSAVVDLGGKGDGWRMILLPNGAAGYITDTQLSLTPGQ